MSAKSHTDLIVADPSWDWGSGKIDSVKDEPRFQPSPHQIPADLDLQENLKGFLNDPALLAQIKQKARGNKPDAELKVRFGPLASGAAVVANRAQLDELIDKNRGILGLEMEAYGVASACRPVRILPCRVIAALALENAVDFCGPLDFRFDFIPPPSARSLPLEIALTRVSRPLGGP